MLGQHCIRTWSSTQSVVALISGESEWYAMLKGASVAVGFRRMVAEMGVGLDVELRTDSRAAKGIAHRVGLGKVKHLAVCYLWLQDAVRLREVDVVKVGTAWNWADVGTKHLDGLRIKELTSKVGYRTEEGRHELAPSVARGVGGRRGETVR